MAKQKSSGGCRNLQWGVSLKAETKQKKGLINFKDSFSFSEAVH